jgi:hypothetical protein
MEQGYLVIFQLIDNHPQCFRGWYSWRDKGRIVKGPGGHLGAVLFEVPLFSLHCMAVCNHTIAEEATETLLKLAGQKPRASELIEAYASLGLQLPLK